MAAVHASAAGARVGLLEKHELPGRKFLMAAMGSGALSNTALSLDTFHGRDARFVADALAALDSETLSAWFEAEGAPLIAGPNYGLLVPRDGPGAVLAALVSALGNTAFMPENRVTKATRSDGGFVITTDDGRKLRAARLVLATGAPNLPQLGGETTGLELARKLGHTLQPVHPLHAPLATSEEWLRGLTGLWMDVRLALHAGPREVATSTGSMLFTQGAVTGQAVFNLTCAGAEALNTGKADTLVVDFFPELQQADVAEWLYRTLGGHTQILAAEALDDMLPRQLGDRLLARLNVKRNARSRDIELRQRESLVAEMTGLRVAIDGTLGMHAAEAATGGVSLREINPRTMESRLVPGLYIVGQMLDINANWGGFLQHFSLASGLLAGQAAGRGLDSVAPQR